MFMAFHASSNHKGMLIAAALALLLSGVGLALL
jgi:hypothetical protein